MIGEDAKHVKYFWRALQRMNQDQRRLFIQFAGARSRLPPAANRWDFRVTSPDSTKPSMRSNPDGSLPFAQVSFFFF